MFHIEHWLKNKDGDTVSKDPLSESVEVLTTELGRISARIRSVNSSFQAQMQQALIAMRAEIEEIRENCRAELQDRIANLADVEDEISRATTQLESIASEIDAMLDDPAAELSAVMRKKSEQTELLAYLAGLRYSIGIHERSKAKSIGKSTGSP